MQVPLWHSGLMAQTTTAAWVQSWLRNLHMPQVQPKKKERKKGDGFISDVSVSYSYGSWWLKQKDTDNGNLNHKSFHLLSINWIYIFLTTTLGDKYSHYPHFTEEKSEAQRGKGTCPGTQEGTDRFGIQAQDLMTLKSSFSYYPASPMPKCADAFSPTKEVHDLGSVNVIHMAMERMYRDIYITNTSVFRLLERPSYLTI